MRIAVLVAMGLLIIVQSAQSEELFTTNTPDCTGGYYDAYKVPYPSGITSYVSVTNWRRLAEPIFQREVLEAAFKKALAYCKSKGLQAGSAVIVAKTVPDGKVVLIGWTSATDRSWHVTLNTVQESAVERDAEDRVRAEQAARRKEREDAAQKEQVSRATVAAKAAADALAETKRLQSEFVSKNNVSTWTNTAALKANPFPVKGKVVGVMTQFSQMVSESEAFFGDLYLSGVPSTAFTRQGQDVVLAFKVSGVKSVKTPIGLDMIMPYGSYVGSYVCTKPGCAEFVGR